MTRWGSGVAALLFAGAADVPGVLVRVHPRAAGALIVASGVLGAAAIGLFSINTAYLLATPLWLVARVLALVAPPSLKRRVVRAGAGRVQASQHDRDEPLDGRSRRQTARCLESVEAVRCQLARWNVASHATDLGGFSQQV